MIENIVLKFLDASCVLLNSCHEFYSLLCNLFNEIAVMVLKMMPLKIHCIEQSDNLHLPYIKLSRMNYCLNLVKLEIREFGTTIYIVRYVFIFILHSLKILNKSFKNLNKFFI